MKHFLHINNILIRTMFRIFGTSIILTMIATNWSLAGKAMAIGYTTTSPVDTANYITPTSISSRLKNTEEDSYYCLSVWDFTDSSSIEYKPEDSDNKFKPLSKWRDDLLADTEDPRTESVREYAYGIMLPTICTLGIVGNILNLVVLTRSNMRGPAYVYMRAYSTAALFAIIFAIPFGLRMIIHKDHEQWEKFGSAFYTAHLEPYLANGCLGVGVMMLLVLTIERYVAVCHPGLARPFLGPPGVVVLLISISTFILYFPSIFRGDLIKCLLSNSDAYVYLRTGIYQKSLFYSVHKNVLEVIFKVIPTVLITGLNMRIIYLHRCTCVRRRQMVLPRRSTMEDDDPRNPTDQRRLLFLLGSTLILYLLCISPMVILHMTMASQVFPTFPFQVFRAMANVLELLNYLFTFYIYCPFSDDFRHTLMITIKCPWVKGLLCHQTEENTEINMTNTPLLHKRNHHLNRSTTCGTGRSHTI